MLLAIPLPDFWHSFPPKSLMKLRLFLLPCLVLLFALGTATAPRRARAEPSTIRYQQDVLPILAQNCLECHGFDPAARQAGLRLDTADGAYGELESGRRAIVPTRPADSSLIARIDSTDPTERMPPVDSGKQLTPTQRELLRTWIEQGAVYEKHWAFELPRQVAIPEQAGVVHPIDRFIQARLSELNLSPSPRADDRTLMRRVCLDLTGLPPSPAELDAYVADAARDAESAYQTLVERLLQSPHYGERWGRWWLDQARYADSDGYSSDDPRVIWAYRDWVVQALNRDMPFDQFTIEQLAGDLLPNASQQQRIATGFHRNTQRNGEGGIDPEQFRVDSIFDRVATTGTVWLGLTIGCAQCHDHKFDPIEQTDFYRLFAILNNQDEPALAIYPPDVDPEKLARDRSHLEQQVQEWADRHAGQLFAWEQTASAEQRAALAAPLQDILRLPAAERNAAQVRDLCVALWGDEDQECANWLQQMAAIQAALDRPLTKTLVLSERAEPRITHRLIKGDFTRPAEVILPGTPAVLHPGENGTGINNRLDLARWIMSPQNPLTARVIVNRVWQVYFGRGIVETDNDFGMQGTPPSHPELLDWLALELQRERWSLKALHRLIVRSHTYQQSSVARQDLRQIDPRNDWLARQRRLRLDAELIRDVALAASGLLSPKMGGPPVFPPIPAGAMRGGQVVREWKVSTGEDRYRRGLYTHLFRATPPPALNVFDAPDGYSVCTRRLRSNTPLQALTLLNDESFHECAQALQQRVEDEGLDQAFCRCTARLPTPAERAVLERLDALSAARTLLNLDETLTRE